MKRGHKLNGPWRLSCTVILTAVMVSPDENRGMLAEEFNISCRYAGVFHVEKNRRYNLTRSEAVELCRALNSTLPTMDQMKKAHELGFETCRYGYIEDRIVIPRIKPYYLCAANNTGIYVLTSNITDRYDTYCYNASETRDMVCEPIIKLNDSWHDNQSRIVIDNADGSRYTNGVKHPEPTPVTDDNHVGSGSTYDGDTTNPTSIRIHTPGAPYYEDTTPDALSTDYSSVSDRKEYHSTSTNDIAISFDDKRGEDSTMISLITDGVPGKNSDHPSKGQHPTSTNLSSHDDGADGEDSTQDPLIPVISLGGDNSDDKEQHPPSSTVNPHHGAHEETSTQHEGNPSPDIWWWSNTDHKEQHPTTATKDEDSQENETDDEDSLQDPLHSGWDTNDDTEQHPPVTNKDVDSHGDPKRIESTEEPLLRNVSLGGDKDEDKYPTNATVDSVKPELFPEKERDHSSSSVTVNNEIGRNTYTPTAVVVSNEGAKNEDSTQDPFLHNVYLGGDKDEDKYATNTNVDSVKPELFPEKERDHSSSSVTVNNEIGRNTYTSTAVVVSNEGAKNEGATQDPFLHNVYLGGDKDEDKYATNTTMDSVKPELFSAKESDHSSSSVTVNNEIGRNTYTSTVVVSNEGAKNEDATQDPFLHNVYLGGDKDEDKYATNTTMDSVKPELFSAKESDHSSSSVTVNNEIGRNTYTSTAMVSNGGTKHEDSTQDPLLRTVHPGWGNADKYPTNVTRDDVLHGIIPASENDQEKESSHTAVVSSDGATHKGSTQDPLLHGAHPGWGNEDKYLIATSRDDVLPGIIPPSETEHKNESSHTAVVSNDGIKHEDSTKDPLAPSIQPGGDNEDKYPTNNPIDNLIPGVFSDIESGHGRGPASTATSSIPNKHGGRRANPSGQVTSPKIASQPRSAQIPEWLIIVASLLALTLILAVCIAVNSRRRCGQKKKLVINNGKGSVSDKKMGGLNGEASKSQEMVHLVHKEQSDNRTGPCDEFLTTDETQNQQEANMKTGM
ncbi:CD44 antigen isoform X4 [Dermochelys coriacea]|uniref:CD44 antigen isoform X4 n=1 Tax=Dermochelys coriacea TaxID=27794 RepID=UPI001CA7BB7F|nr:CD44 antigen isoform X4 [Dermochelys coriacea]